MSSPIAALGVVTGRLVRPAPPAADKRPRVKTRYVPPPHAPSKRRVDTAAGWGIAPLSMVALMAVRRSAPWPRGR